MQRDFMSGSKSNLVQGIVGLVGTLALEGVSIFNLIEELLDKSKPLQERLAGGIGVLFVIQIAVLLTLLMTWDGFATYKRRRKFTIYAIELTNDTDIDKLKEDYHICNISQNGLIYVSNEDRKCFYDFTTNRRDVCYESFTHWCKEHPEETVS